MLAELVSGLNGGEFIALVAVAGGLLFVTLTVIVSVIGSHWRRVRLTELESSLKQQMLDKGLSVEDIERVLKASSQPDENQSALSPVGGPGSDRAALVEHLAEYEFSAEDIERVLRAMQDLPGQPPTGAAGPGRIKKNAPDKVAAVTNMLDNGMSVEDIERVLRAFGGPGVADLGAADKAALVEKMLSCDLSAEDIERVLLALQGPEEAERMASRESLYRQS
jgi:hypothetical protein